MLTPMLQVMNSSWPSTVNGLDSVSISFCAQVATSCTSRTGRIITVYSSPPRRATMSLSRRQARKRWATCCSSASPV